MNFVTNLNPKNRLIFDLCILLVFSVFLVTPIYFWGIPGGHDMYQHFQFANVYFDALSNGNIYPGWSHLPNYESGDVSVRFYPPLTYYFLAFFRWVSGNWFEGTCLMFVFVFFIGSLGTYKWAREYFTENGALIGALTYAMLPYHINQIYQGSLIAEFTAASVLPFCFLFITRICRNGKAIDVCGLAIAYSFLILSHLPTTLMASMAFLIYSLISLKKDRYVRTVVQLGLSVFTALVLSSFYWMRMIFELDFVKHATDSYSTAYYSYKSNFVFPYLLDLLNIKSNQSILYIDLLCLVPLAILGYSLFLYYSKTRDKSFKPLGKVLIVALFSLFMTTPLSQFIWEYVPALSRIQFPWRWLIVFSLMTAFITAAGFEVVLEYFKTSKRYLAIIMLGLFGICFIYEYAYILNHLSYYPKDFFISIVDKNKTMPSNECWWTSWTEQSKEPKPGLPRPELLPAKIVLNERTFQIKKWEPTERILTMSPGPAGQAEFATSYYPHWKATVNGNPVEVTPNEFGAISFAVPSDESEIRVYFQEPRHVIATYYLAGTAWLIMSGILALCFFKARRIK